MSPTAVVKLHAGMTPAQALATPAFIDPTREADRLTIALRPASRQEALEVIRFLVDVLPMENRGETRAEKEAMVAANFAAYASALSDFPHWAISDAGQAFMDGRVSGQSLTFAPKPPMFAAETRRRVDHLRAKLSRMRRQADEKNALGAEDERRPLSPDVRERGRLAIERLRAASRDDLINYRRAGPEYIDPNPITEEALDAAGVPRAPDRGTGAMQRIEPPAFDPMRRRSR